MCTPLEHNNLASDKILPPTNHNAPAMRSSYAAAQCPPSTRGPQSAYRPAERAEGGLCALHAAPNPMSEREHELHRRMTSLTERHRAWPRSWARTEWAVPRDPFAAGVGSSPHTRGTRSTPWNSPSPPGDHPRIRGEHELVVIRPSEIQGIIPAYAGNTTPPRHYCDLWQGSSPHTRGTLSQGGMLAAVSRDHPRIRGEHVGLRVRVCGVRGIIPAYAGNTSRASSARLIMSGSSPHTRGTPARRTMRRARRWDHPRIRGEHDVELGYGIPEPGIIPAYAGNTMRVGETYYLAEGSSPHTRGTQRFDVRPW